MSFLQPEMRTFSFGPFVLVPHRQLLAKGSTPVRVGIRCFDILTVLVERAGELVTKEELLSRVWPNTFVEESNLKVNVAALRRVLGDNSVEPQYVATANGRGYRFIAPVEEHSHSEGTRRPLTQNLPVQITRPVGRDEIVHELSERLTQRRLVTIAGAGGIGKTTVAVAAATQLRERSGQRVCFADMAPVRDPDRVPVTLAEALAGDRGPHPLLMIIDNCEHLVDAIASAVESMLCQTGHLHLLATSREPLGVKAEQVYRLPSLEVPQESTRLTAREALGYPSIELFVERATASAAYCLTDEDVPVLSEVCRKLDGNPLAIELAAARMDPLGLRGLAALVGHRMSLLNLGIRTGPQRHRTLAAALDWSYDLLSRRERVLLRRLSLFTGTFRLETALGAVVESLSCGEIAECLAGLIAKSLVVPDACAGVTHLRLPETTRAYLAQKFEDGEAEPPLWHGAMPTSGNVAVA